MEIQLPELVGKTTPKAEELKVVVQEPKVEEPKVEVPKVETPKAATPKVEAPKVESKPEPVRQVRAASTPRPLVSLSDILSGGMPKGEVAEEVRVESRIDPRSEELLNLSREAILEFISSWRPRFAVTFGAMTFEGHKIAVKVPTSELKTEIERSMSELLHKVVEIAGIGGLVELEIILDEKIVATRPVKLEDKIAHLVKINPELSKFKERFNLYIE